MKRHILPTLASVLLGGLLVLGVARLFALRFEAGDVYPPYSSLRSDPLGTRALYEALAGMPGLQLERFFSPTEKLAGHTGETLLVLGLRGDIYVDKGEMIQIKSYVAAGNRVVISLLPTRRGPPKAGSTPTPANEEEESKKEEEEEQEEPLSLGEHLQFSLTYLEPGKSYTAKAEVPVLEPEISWHSTAVFKTDNPAWRTIYAVEGRPVIIERRYGPGSIVVASDSFLFSNEALRDERCPRLLAWFAGDNPRIVFDETHHGIAEDPGIMTLMNRYRLQPLLAVFLVLGALFVWRNALPLVPRKPQPEGSGREIVVGRDASRARVNLLRRSISAADLAAVAVDLWKRSFAHRLESHPGVLDSVDALLADERARRPRERRPLDTYRRIAELLRKRTGKTTFK